jgi:hypothetical protein
VIENFEIEQEHYREMNLNQEVTDLASLSMIDPLEVKESRKRAIDFIIKDKFDHLPSENELEAR